MKIKLKNIFQNFNKIIHSSLFVVKKTFESFLIVFSLGATAFMDASHPWQLGFQDPASPIMEGIIFFNGFLMAFMLFIACLVGWLLYKCLTLYHEDTHPNPVSFSHSTLLEVVWTIIPAGILMIISIPSYNLLYAMDEVIDPSVTIKVVGHQWYWSYECSDFDSLPEAGETSLSEEVSPAETLCSRLNSVNLLVKSSSNSSEGMAAWDKYSELPEVKAFLERVGLRLKSVKGEEYLDLHRSLENLQKILSSNLELKNFKGGVSEFPEEGILDAISKAEDRFYGNSLKGFLPCQKNAVLDIIKTFSQLLKLQCRTELKYSTYALVDMLDRITQIHYRSNSTPGQLILSDKSYLLPDKNNEIEVIEDLEEYDYSAPGWKWHEFESSWQECLLDGTVLHMIGSRLLTTEKVVNNAILAGDEDNKVLNLINLYRRDLMDFREAFWEADLSESKYIDIRLIDHDLLLTRRKRESFSSIMALERAKKGYEDALSAFKRAEVVLANSKYHNHLAKIDLEAANVNDLTAKYFAAESALQAAHPELVSSFWISAGGYDSWTPQLKLAAKNLAEEDRLKYMEAYAKCHHARCLLRRSQEELTPEEITRSNLIANNSMSLFFSLERERISMLSEYLKGKPIAKDAAKDLEAFKGILCRSDIRLSKAQNEYDIVQSNLNRASSKLKASKLWVKETQSRLGETAPDNVCFKTVLEAAQNKLTLARKHFEEALIEVVYAQSDVDVMEFRSKIGFRNKRETEEQFFNTNLLEKQMPKKGKPDEPVEYYPNYMWELVNEDLAYVDFQLEVDAEKMLVVKKDLQQANTHLDEAVSSLVSARFEQGKALISFLESTGDEDLANKEKEFLLSLKLELSEVIRDVALANWEATKSLELRHLLDLVYTELNKVKSREYLVGNSLNSLLPIPYESINLKDLVNNYAKNCIKHTLEELTESENDYAYASKILGVTEKVLFNLRSDLGIGQSNPYFDTMLDLLQKGVKSVTECTNKVNSSRFELSPLEVKLNPGLLQTKSYGSILESTAELAHAKWLYARITKTLDLPLPNELKPYNARCYPFAKPEDYPLKEIDYPECPIFPWETIIPTTANGGNYGFKDHKFSPALYDDKSIEELFDSSKKRKVSYDIESLSIEILQLYQELLKTISMTQAHELLELLNETLTLVNKKEIKHNNELVSQLNMDLSDTSSVSSDESVDDSEDEEEEETQRINFDSYLIGDDDLVIPEPYGKAAKAGKVFRLLEVDNRLVVPTNTHIRLLVTSADVLHSWAVPSLGIKVDACPGRLNQVFLFVKREGVFYGQCSEICGVNHGFMPIVVQAVNQDKYLSWVGKRLCS